MCLLRQCDDKVRHGITAAGLAIDTGTVYNHIRHVVTYSDSWVMGNYRKNWCIRSTSNAIFFSFKSEVHLIHRCVLFYSVTYRERLDLDMIRGM